MKNIYIKKLVLFSLIAAGLFQVIANCEKKNGRGPDKTPVNGEITCRLLTDAGGVDDRSFAAAAWRGILQYYGDVWDNTAGRGKYYDVVTALTHDQYSPNIQLATDEKFDLIIVTGFTFASALAEAAGKNPDQKYLIVDADWLDLPNGLQTTFAEHEGSFLVGAAAALKAIEDNIPNPRFGFIGGMASSTITKFEMGFIQGILSILPNTRIDDYYVGSWNDPGLAKAQAKNWYDQGVFMIYSAAGMSGNGTIAQAKEYRAQGRNVWAIGVDSDQFEEGLYNAAESAVYTSMLKKVEMAVLYGLQSVKNGSFRGEVINFDLKADGVGFSAANPALSGNIRSKVNEAAQKIINGQITVVPTYAAAGKFPGFPQNLQARDD
ncbi:MAG: BMP family ABC transporter substrate-binding protein [Treponema sp.]|jgi:basic membrane protein A|nr:BMP family ABC transporter substrate-binding protein [Treponema sp.]